MISRTTGALWHGSGKAELGQIQRIDEGVDEPNGVFRRDIIVNCWGKQEGLGTIGACDVSHVPSYHRMPVVGIQNVKKGTLYVNSPREQKFPTNDVQLGYSSIY